MCLSDAADSRHFCQLLEDSIISGAVAAAALFRAAALARRLGSLFAPCPAAARRLLPVAPTPVSTLAGNKRFSPPMNR